MEARMIAHTILATQATKVEHKKINGQARYELECIKLWGAN